MTHGTLSGYSIGCRCDACKAQRPAVQAKLRAYRQRPAVQAQRRKKYAEERALIAFAKAQLARTKAAVVRDGDVHACEP